jgi:hypothetical protein
VVKILKFFDVDPGWKNFGSGMEKIRIRDRKSSDPGQTSRIRNTGIMIQKKLYRVRVTYQNYNFQYEREATKKHAGQQATIFK